MPTARTAAATDWDEIVGLYDLLLGWIRHGHRLNRGRVAMRDGPEAGLAMIDGGDHGTWELREYRLAHAARAELCRRLGRMPEARTSFRARARADPAGTRAASAGTTHRVAGQWEMKAE